MQTLKHESALQTLTQTHTHTHTHTQGPCFSRSLQLKYYILPGNGLSCDESKLKMTNTT